MQYILNDNRESEIQLSGVSDNISFSGDITLRSIGITALDVPQRELDALVALYNSTSGDSWTDKTNWLQTGTVNDWFGITVSGGHVTEISLNNNNLNGSMGTVLPPLGGYLTTLDLSDNPNLTYPYLGLQTALATIDISNCGLGSASVAARLAEVVANGVSAGTLDIGGSNSSPNPAGVTSLLALEDDSWTLTYSTVIMENTGSFYAITADGDATIRSSATDLSGQTAKYIVAYDGTNDKYAFAYGHAADDAESLGGELITSWSTPVAFPYETFTVNANGHDIDQAVNSAGGGYAYTLFSLAAGNVIKIPTTISINSGAADVLLITASSIGNPVTTIKSSLSGSETFYRTWTSSDYGLIFRNLSGTIDFSLLISAKQVTALGVDSLQLRDQTAESGSSRNWTSIESGFDPNTISKIEVFLG